MTFILIGDKLDNTTFCPWGIGHSKRLTELILHLQEYRQAVRGYSQYNTAVKSVWSPWPKDLQNLELRMVKPPSWCIKKTSCRYPRCSSHSDRKKFSLDKTYSKIKIGASSLQPRNTARHESRTLRVVRSIIRGRTQTNLGLISIE